MANTITIDIPGGSIEVYRTTHDRAKQVYWAARSQDKSETWALKAVVDDLLRQQDKATSPPPAFGDGIQDDQVM